MRNVWPLKATPSLSKNTRARPGGLIATPLSWKELESGAVPADFTLESVVARVAKRFKDPWKSLLTKNQSLTAKIIEALDERV